jgi:hypothetical protein
VIFVLTTARHGYTFDAYLSEWEPELSARIRMLSYEALFRMRQVPSGTYLFTDLERLTRPEITAAQLVWNQLSDSGRARCLNQPERFVSRYRLLKTLYQMGENQFNVYRPWELNRIERFPVFIRQTYEHGGGLTELLNSPAEVIKALGHLRLRAQALARLLIVEYCDVSDRQGVSCKYGIFKIGERVIPRHLHCSTHWMVKVQSDDPRTVRLAGEEVWYEQNPHESWARQMFALAGVDYGRVDYGVGRRGLQLWEINTNAVVFNPKKGMAPERLPHRARVARWLREALEALEEIPSTEGPIPIQVPAGLLAQARAVRVARDGRDRFFEGLVERGSKILRRIRA